MIPSLVPEQQADVERIVSAATRIAVDTSAVCRRCREVLVERVELADDDVSLGVVIRVSEPVKKSRTDVVAGGERHAVARFQVRPMSVGPGKHAPAFGWVHGVVGIPSSEHLPEFLPIRCSRNHDLEPLALVDLLEHDEHRGPIRVAVRGNV